MKRRSEQENEPQAERSPGPDELPPAAYDWHHKLSSLKRCPICGYHAKLRGEHRAVRPYEPYRHRWLRRTSEGEGWKVEEVGPMLNPLRPARTDARDQYTRISHTRRNSLARYFHHTFAPTELAGKSPHTRHQYERAIFKLCDYCRRDVSLGEIHDGLIDNFVEWCIRSGLTFDVARKYRVYVRRVVRHARPGTCPKQSGRRPHEAADDSARPDDDALDIDGSLWRFLEQFYKPKRLVGRAADADANYKLEIRRLRKHLGHAPMVAELSDDLLLDHQDWMLENGFAPRTVNGMTTAIRTLWNAAADYGLIATRPTVRKIPVPKRLPEAWTIEELSRIVGACSVLKGTIKGISAPDWFRAFLLVAYDSGLRRRALLAILRSDLDLNSGWLTVPAESMKNGVEQRFHLTTQTIEAVRKVWLPLREFLFPDSRDGHSYYERFGRILEAAGLENTPKNKTHKIRRTTATQLAVHVGLDAAIKQLGHSSETVTRGYIDPRALSTHDRSAALPRPKF